MTADSDIPLNVDTTAIVVAMSRLEESLEPDPLLFDPYIMMLLGKNGISMARKFFDNNVLTREELQRYISLRHRIGDDLSTGEGVEQVVILASGLDTRAWRFPIANLYEIDRSDIFHAKRSRLPPAQAKNHVCIQADLVKDNWQEKLLESGFDPLKPTIWLAEGLLMYLTQDQIGSMLSHVNNLSATGSKLFFDQTVTSDSGNRFTNMFESTTSPDTFDMDFQAVLKHGWNIIRRDFTNDTVELFGRVFEPYNAFSLYLVQMEKV